MKNLFLSLIVMVSSLIMLSSCESRSGQKMRAEKFTKDSIASANKKDSIEFKKSLFLSGEMYFTGKEKVTTSMVNYGFVWTSDQSLSIVLFPGFPKEIVPVEIADKVKDVIQTKYNKQLYHFNIDNKRVYLQVGKTGDFTDPLEESLSIVKIIQKETGWQITTNSWNDPVK